MPFEADTTQDILRRVFDPTTYKLKVQQRVSSTGAKIKSATLAQSGVTATTTPYLLIDLSDTTNYMHAATNAILLLGLSISGVATAGTFRVDIGVIVELDATDGTARFLRSIVFPTAVNVDRLINFDEGIDLGVTSGVLDNIVTNSADANSVNWQTDVTIAGPGGNAAPGVGDLVVLVTETAAGSLDFEIEALYVAR